ncbi:hypothetical protein [Catenuloplanes indicus]|uniref:Membrane protein n=1 Tax=Catenuloplanes indicus TaxID=137267 RepID=A0AAE3W869_9ACTN|nr:hypothetical protein [Catenuloplanes indicus]MDQ0371648.1 putative membrane protein [Catenuloplanes indicus]
MSFRLPRRQRPSGDPAAIRNALALQRELTAIQRQDEHARAVDATRHEIASASLDEQRAAARHARIQRAREAAARAGLADLYRHAERDGEYARIRSAIHGSAEMRALRINRVRAWSLLILIPVFAVFAGWSTVNVHAGVAHLLHAESGSAMWWAAWFVEPGLATLVAGLIIVKAVLHSSGGHTDWKASAAEGAALGASVLLSAFGAGTFALSAVGEMFTHSIGAIFAALTVFLIGLIESYVSAADPWKGAPRLADLQLGVMRTPPSPVTVTATVTPPPVVTAPVVTDAIGGDAVTVTPAIESDASPATVTDAPGDAVTPAVTATATPAEATPSPAPSPTPRRTPSPRPRPAAAAKTVTAQSSVTVTADQARALSRDLVEQARAGMTDEQVEQYAEQRAQAVLAEDGTKVDGMREYWLTCVALGIEPKGTRMAKAVSGAESKGRTLAKKWNDDLAIGEAEHVLTSALERIAAERAGDGDE